MPPERERGGVLRLESGNSLVRIFLGRGSYGTGFVIHHDIEGTYIVTCRHVVFNDSQKREFKIDLVDPARPAVQYDAEVIFDPRREHPSSTLDLAVLLCNAEPLRGRRPLKLGRALGTQRYQVIRYSAFYDDPRRLPQEGYAAYEFLMRASSVDEPFRLSNREDLKIEHGHSGSPVIDVDENIVIGVVTTVAPAVSQSQTAEGPAPIGVTSIRGLKMWRNPPAGLIPKSRVPAWVRPLPPGVQIGAPVRIVVAASNGLDNEVAVVGETIQRTSKSPAARALPVELLAWAGLPPNGSIVVSADSNSWARPADDAHGIILLHRPVEDQVSTAQLGELERRTRTARIGLGPYYQRRLIYRLFDPPKPGNSSTSPSPPPDDFFAGLDRDAVPYLTCSTEDFADSFWNDYQDLFPYLVDLSQHPHDASLVRDGGPAAKVTDDQNPYRGLRAYRLADGNVYHGRAKEVTKLRDLLFQRSSGLLAVIGMSGSGKSSLIRAGLFYRLDLDGIRGAGKWLRTEVNLAKFRPARMKGAPAPPSIPPLTATAKALADVLPSDREYSYADVEQDLRGPDPGKLVDIALEQLPRNARLVLFVDQFEEIFTLVLNAAQRDEFLSCLRDLAQHPRTNIILTIRSDFYAQLQETSLGRLPEVREPFWLPPPDRPSLYKVIALPAGLAGVSFEDDELVTQILADAGWGPGALPLLSYALTRLVDAALKGRGNQITRALYEEIGRVQGAIQKEADEVMEDLNPKPETLHRLFGRLVTVSPEGTATRKPAFPPAEPDGYWKSEELELMRRLVDKRLLLTGLKEGTQIGTLEVAHEALLVRWTQLNKWIEGAKADLQLMRSVEIEAHEWQAELEKAHKAASNAPLWQRELTIHRTLLWPQDRLNRVYEAMDHLESSRESLPPDVRAFIRKETDRLRDELRYPIPQERRAFIGGRLTDLDDPRSGVGLLRDEIPDIEWQEVPPGDVTIYHEDGRSLSTRHVARFRIAKFPVTLAQFELFTKPAVYFKSEWWTDLGVDPEQHRPRSQPAGPSFPAYYVSWPQAIAYCRWLTKELGYTVRIPTEWEWQQAATSGDPKNLYPWGEEWEPEHANHVAGLNRPMVVGLYPAGAALGDVFDMSGNTYEWCMNAFDDPEFLALTGPTHRASRGGAYFEGFDHLTTRHRRRDPAIGVNDLGRTIVVSIRLACDISDPRQVAVSSLKSLP
jgi:hypothetical protein